MNELNVKRVFSVCSCCANEVELVFVNKLCKSLYQGVQVQGQGHYLINNVAVQAQMLLGMLR